jgi:hypothetical protein
LQARAEKETAIFNFLLRFQTQEGTGKHLEDLQARAEKEIRYNKQLLELLKYVKIIIDWFLKIRN